MQPFTAMDVSEEARKQEGSSQKPLDEHKPKVGVNKQVTKEEADDLEVIKENSKKEDK